jgi:hypothetical protein
MLQSLLCCPSRRQRQHRRPPQPPTPLTPQKAIVGVNADGAPVAHFVAPTRVDAIAGARDRSGGHEIVAIISANGPSLHTVRAIHTVDPPPPSVEWTLPIGTNENGTLIAAALGVGAKADHTPIFRLLLR